MKLYISIAIKKIIMLAIIPSQKTSINFDNNYAND